MFGYNSVCLIKTSAPLRLTRTIELSEDKSLLLKQTPFDTNQRKKPRWACSVSTKSMDERIYCGIQALHFKGKAGEITLSGAVYVCFYSNKVKGKQEKQVTHTYPLIKAKSFMEATK